MDACWKQNSFLLTVNVHQMEKNQINLVSSPQMKREKKFMWDLCITLVLPGNRGGCFSRLCRQCQVCFVCCHQDSSSTLGCGFGICQITGTRVLVSDTLSGAVHAALTPVPKSGIAAKLILFLNCSRKGSDVLGSSMSWGCSLFMNLLCSTEGCAEGLLGCGMTLSLLKMKAKDLCGHREWQPLLWAFWSLAFKNLKKCHVND